MNAQPAYSLAVGTPHSFDRDASKAVGTPYSATPSSFASVRIRRLPLNTSEESLRLMMVFSKDILDVELEPAEQFEDPGFRSAIITFQTLAGAQEAKNMLDGKSNVSNDAKLIVEIISGSPITGRNGSSAASSVNSSRQTTGFTSTYSSFERVSPTMNSVYRNSGDLTTTESSAPYQSIFSPHSPIGNYLSDRTRMTGKDLINNDAADDYDETRELLKDPLSFAENGSMAAQQRRATAPQIPIQRMSALSLNTNQGMGPSSMPPYAGHQGLGALSAHPGNTMSPTGMNGAGPSMNYNLGGHSYGRPQHNFPPVNPADQNPPCNTLYVGNLPIDTSEEELKAMFSKQRGYKRLCFRTKQNGPMCFVEFEDVSFATKTLHELYGQLLHNSVKGGIRLSFSKNPLGVRSGQTPTPASSSAMNGLNSGMSTSGHGFTSANGPPPGLSAPPPGLGMGRMSYNHSISNNANSYTPSGYGSGSSSPWGSSSLHHSPMASGGPNSFLNSGANYQSYMAASKY